MLFAVSFQFSEFKSVNVSSLRHTLNKSKAKETIDSGWEKSHRDLKEMDDKIAAEKEKQQTQQ